MKVKQIKAALIPMALLLEADPSESCIRSYLAGSLCFAAFDNDELLGACVTNVKQAGVTEVYNIAVFPEHQNRGVGSELLSLVIKHLTESGVKEVVLGTGTFGYQLAFYQSLGFRVEGVIKNFFKDHYDEPIFENGLQHIDMLRLSLKLNGDKSQ